MGKLKNVNLWKTNVVGGITLKVENTNAYILDAANKVIWKAI